jgi:hypothetical protein
METIRERYSDKIRGVLSCYDRIVIHGNLPGLSFAQGMTSYLFSNNIRIFDYPRFAEPFRDKIRENAELLAEQNGLEIEFLRKNNVRKEKLIKAILEKRGDHPGLVHIFSAMEACQSYKPWHDKKTRKTFLKPADGKCLHYYFYYIDELLGLCYFRVPTWCPFRLQVYFNGHGMLASQLSKRDIDYTLGDNAFLDISDFTKAQKFSDNLRIDRIHRILDRLAYLFCPVTKELGVNYHWSIMQAEYATDIVFKKQEDLQKIYGDLTLTAIHTVKPEHISTFLGRKLHGNYEDEMGNDFNTRIEGTRIKHSMGPVSIKMYDKFSLVLRIETTVNNVSFFKHYREVEHRDGTSGKKLAQMKKTIYSLPALRELLQSSNYRYEEFISHIEDRRAGVDKLKKLTNTIVENKHSYKGFNLFDKNDQVLFESIARGEFVISGFQNKNLRSKFLNKTSGQISRMLKRLRLHGLIKKIGRTYKYYLTRFGQNVIMTGLKLKEFFIIPELALDQKRIAMNFSA